MHLVIFSYVKWLVTYIINHFQPINISLDHFKISGRLHAWSFSLSSFISCNNNSWSTKFSKFALFLYCASSWETDSFRTLPHALLLCIAYSPSSPHLPSIIVFRSFHHLCIICNVRSTCWQSCCFSLLVLKVTQCVMMSFLFFFWFPF